MDTVTRNAFKKLLPSAKTIKVPDVETARYPSAILNILPDGETYSKLGFIAEDLLRLPIDQITMDALRKSILNNAPETTDIEIQKVRQSKTTQPFLDCLIETRRKLEAVARGEIHGESEITSTYVQGHPDARTETQIFEIKLTGMLKDNWQSFIYQVFSYAAIDTTVSDIYLVLPLQKAVWHHSVSDWKGRAAFLNLLNETSQRLQRDAYNDMIVGSAIREEFRIGFHMKKEKTLVKTIHSIPDFSKPYQIFLGGPQSSTLTLHPIDLAATSSLIHKHNAQLYVHSQYIINLAHRPTDDTRWNTKLLKRNLAYASAVGCKGVVVHVGKSTSMAYTDALENMRMNISKALKYASPSCPLLLETPAGQGTEMLKGVSEFIEFVQSFNDPRLRICLDTCHVFACGHSPIEYIDTVAKHSDLLKLIHYNDSATPCGSCVDRHAMMGTGHIGMDGMHEIAKKCSGLGVPMVIE
jgi:deoxyribonuclease-4